MGSTTISVVRDVPYVTGSDAHEKQKLDIYVPVVNQEARNKLPVIMHVHGGGWQRGDRKIWFYGAPFMASSFCRHGYLVFNISYRLSKHAAHPAQIQDVAKAVKWIYDRVESYGGDKDRFYVSGHSAGGHLVTLISSDHSYLKTLGVDPSFIKGVASISGIYNLKSPMTAPDACWSLRTSLFHKVYVKPTFGTVEKEWDDASPITYCKKNDVSIPPTVLINAQFDMGLELGAVSFKEVLENRGVTVEHHTVSTTAHGSVSRSESTVELILQFLEKRLK